MRLAVGLVAKHETFQELTADARIYLVDVEVFRDKGAETGRQVLVTHYRTEGDLAILSRVDLRAGNVVGVESVAHLPVRLSNEEYKIARRMALEHPTVEAALRGLEVEVEAQVSRTFAEDDPQFGHRVVHLLFKTPKGYLESPAVIVDLTAGEITVE